MSRIGIGKWDVVLAADATSLMRAMDSVTGRMQRAESTMDRHAKGITASFAKIGRGIMAAQTLFIGWAGVVAGSRLIHWFASASEEVDQLGKAAKRLGMTAEDLSGLKFAAGEAGIEFDQLAKMMSKAARSVQDLVDRGQTATQIGNVTIKLTDAAGQVRSMSALLPDLARGIESAGSQAEQLRLAERFFGRGGGDSFVTFLKESGRLIDGLPVAIERARRLGVIVTDEQVERLTEMNDAIGRIGKALTGLAVKVLADVAPVLTTLSNKFASAVASVPQVIDNLTKLIRDALGREGEDMQLAAIEKISAITGALANTVRAGVEMLFRVGVAAGLDAISSLPNLIAPVLTGAFVNIFAASAADAQTFVAKQIEGFFPATAQEMIRRAEAGMAEARKRLVTATAEDINKAVQAIGAGELSTGEWKKGMQGIEREGGNLLDLLDRALNITDVLASHAMTGFETVQTGAKDTGEQFDELGVRVREFADNAENAIKGFSQSASSALADVAVDGEADIVSLGKAWTKTLISMAADALLFKPIFESLGPAFGNAFRSSDSQSAGSSQIFGPPSPNAHGSVMVPRRAAHGIIDRPTYLPQLNAIAGEANRAEVAIAPLQRIGSDLGVKAVPATVAVQIIDQRGSGSAPSVSETTGPDGRKILRVLIRDEVKGMFQDGSADRVMGSQYGLRRRGARR